jgi:hypothetical protein
MGTWSVEPFENDTAADWVWDLEDSPSVDPLLAALDVGPAYIEADAGVLAVCAAHLLAAARDPARVVEIPEDLLGFLKRHRGTLLAIDPQPVIALLKRVLDEDDSELAQLWQESDEDYAKWQAHTAGIVATLAAPPMA